MSYQAKLGMITLLNALNCKDEIKKNSLQLNYVDATKKSTDLAKDYNDAKKSIAAEYEQDTAEYDKAMEEVENEFEFLKAQNAEYENEVQMQLENVNTKITSRDKYVETLKGQIGQEVQEDHTYGFNS